MLFSCPDYPYRLAGKELRGVIKGLIGRCTDVLPDLVDHCIYTMLRELDRQTGMAHLLGGRLVVRSPGGGSAKGVGVPRGQGGGARSWHGGRGWEPGLALGG